MPRNVIIRKVQRPRVSPTRSIFISRSRHRVFHSYQDKQEKNEAQLEPEGCEEERELVVVDLGEEVGDGEDGEDYFGGVLDGGARAQQDHRCELEDGDLEENHVVAVGVVDPDQGLFEQSVDKVDQPVEHHKRDHKVSQHHILDDIFLSHIPQSVQVLVHEGDNPQNRIVSSHPVSHFPHQYHTPQHQHHRRHHYHPRKHTTKKHSHHRHHKHKHFMQDPSNNRQRPQVLHVNRLVPSNKIPDINRFHILLLQPLRNIENQYLVDPEMLIHHFVHNFPHVHQDGDPVDFVFCFDVVREVLQGEIPEEVESLGEVVGGVELVGDVAGLLVGGVDGDEAEDGVQREELVGVGGGVGGGEGGEAGLEIGRGGGGEGVEAGVEGDGEVGPGGEAEEQEDREEFEAQQEGVEAELDFLKYHYINIIW